MEQRHTFFLVPQNEDDSAIDKWDITDNDILDVLTSHGLKKESGTDIVIEWVLSSGIPHFAVKNVGKDNAKVLQGLCELEGIELASGHFVTVDNVIYGVGFTEIKDDKKDRKSKKDKKRGGKSGKGTTSEKDESNQTKFIAETVTDLIQAKNLDNLIEFCSHVSPSELRDSQALRPAAVLALVYQLALCLPSSSGITDDDDNSSSTKTALAWLETFTNPSYIKGFGVKVLKVFCDVVVPVASKRLVFCPAPETISSNVSSLVEMYSGLDLMDILKRLMSKALVAELGALGELNQLSRERYEKSERIAEAAVRLLTTSTHDHHQEEEEERSSELQVLACLWKNCFYEPITFYKSRIREKRSSSQGLSSSTSSSLVQPSYSTSSISPALKKFKAEETVDIHAIINAGIRTFRSIVCKLQDMWGMSIIEPTGESCERAGGTTAAAGFFDFGDEIMGDPGLSRAIEICYKSLIFLGDLHRHWFMLNAIENSLFREARKFYLRARALKPGEGFTFNQLGALESYVDDPLLTICFYAIGDASATPNRNSSTNITGELLRFSKRKAKAKTIQQPRERFTTTFLNLFSVLFAWMKKGTEPTAASKVSRNVSDVLSALEAVVVRLNNASGNGAFKFLAEAVVLETYLCNSTLRDPKQFRIARDLLYQTISRIVCSGVSFPPASIALEVAHIFLMWFLGSDGNTSELFSAESKDLWTSAWDSVSNLLNCLLTVKDQVHIVESEIMCEEEALLCGAAPYSKVIRQKKSPWKGQATVLYDECPELYSLRKRRLLELGMRVAKLVMRKNAVQALYWCEEEARFSHFCPKSQAQFSPSLLSSSSSSSQSSSSSSSQGKDSQKGFITNNEVDKKEKEKVLRETANGTPTDSLQLMLDSCFPCCCSQNKFLLPSQSFDSSEKDEKDEKVYNSNCDNDKKDDGNKRKPFDWLTKEWL